ncbi:MAG: ATP-binding protein [Gammaproteobacteria bacterium]|nr:ATP-binding protein [Gammaproteobacteria bacterium]
MRLELLADLAQLNRIREFVTESATALGIAPASFDDLRLAVDEAVTNILTHGYCGPGEIEIEMATDGADLVIRVRDKATSFDAAHTPPNDPHTSQSHDAPGGFGLYLIRTAMDEVLHRPLHPGNELTMIKRGVAD